MMSKTCIWRPISDKSFELKITRRKLKRAEKSRLHTKNISGRFDRDDLISQYETLNLSEVRNTNTKVEPGFNSHVVSPQF